MSELVNHEIPPKQLGLVLLVDDDQKILSAYGRVLRSAGFEVETLSDGVQVRAALAHRRYDLLISDISLGEMSGIEVLRIAREHDPDLPVVLMTGGGDLETAVKAMELGALRYLLKPVVPPVLKQAAEDGLKLRKMADLKRRAFELYGEAAQIEEDHAELTARFERALEKLFMVYQPVVRWSDRTIYAYEALVRTGEPTLGRPDHFFTAAEKLGRLDELGRTIRSSVARTVKTAPHGHQIFVNVHPHDLQDAELWSPDAPLSSVASQVVLEITERASLDRVPDLRARLGDLRQLGFKLALDDLGAGYAGLNTFMLIQPDLVKLDMALTRGVHEDRTKQKLVDSMVTLCRDLRMLVVAEGVEVSEEREVLVHLGCDLLQGYLFAKPGAPFPAVKGLNDE